MCNPLRLSIALIVFAVPTVLAAGCSRAGGAATEGTAEPSEPPAETPEHAPAQPAEKPTVAPADKTSDADGVRLNMEGVTVMVPKEWKALPTDGGPMSAKHVFALPKVEGDAEDGQVRITHFPGMKGMDEQNLARWIGQVQKPDGTPYTRDEVKVEIVEEGNVRLSIVDLTGAVKATMRAAPKADSRMIAAILDHPSGPHFVVASGPKATIVKWNAKINDFLRSAKAK